MRYLLKNQTLFGYYVGFVFSEFDKLKKEFKDVFDLAPVEIKLDYNTYSVVNLWNTVFTKKYDVLTETTTYQDIMDEFQRYINRDIDVMMNAMFSYKAPPDHNPLKDSDIIKVTKLHISINGEKLRSEILANIYQLDVVERDLKLGIRHECGHIMDYILNYNNHTFEECKKLSEEYNNDKDEYFKTFYDENGKIKPDVNEDDRIRYYYTNLAGERIANELAGVDVEEILEVENLLSHHQKDYEVDFSIKCDSIKEYDE